jgi:membrane protease YdiL (CAAX protease family)
MVSVWRAAPETPEQKRWAALSVRRRIGTACVATLLLGCVVLPTYALRKLLVFESLGQSEASALRGLILQFPTAVVVWLLARRLTGRLANAGLQLSGAGVSLAFTVPMILLTVFEHQMAAAPSLERVLLVLVLGLVVGVVEELYGRGVLVTVLGGRSHAALAIVGSSVLFAYLHMPVYWQLHGFRGAFLRCASSAAFSAVFALIRLRSGSIIGPIAFHIIDDVRYLLDARSGTSSSDTASIRPFIIGSVVATLYWLACRGALSNAARQEPTAVVS